jgi:hypothetical protein
VARAWSKVAHLPGQSAAKAPLHPLRAGIRPSLQVKAGAADALCNYVRRLRRRTAIILVVFDARLCSVQIKSARRKAKQVTATAYNCTEKREALAREKRRHKKSGVGWPGRDSIFNDAMLLMSSMGRILITPRVGTHNEAPPLFVG